MKNVIIASFILGIIACNEPANNTETPSTATDTTAAITTPPKEEKKEPSDSTLQNKYLITENGLVNIKIGDTIIQHKKYLKKAVQENGEGDFPGYDLLDENQEVIGFVFSDDDNNTYKENDLVGSIEIYSPLYKTKEGIGVNSTFENLKKTYPQAKTNGSEIEGWTSTNLGGLSFRLDAYFNTYEIDETKIKPSTKVVHIGIWGANNE